MTCRQLRAHQAHSLIWLIRPNKPDWPNEPDTQGGKAYFFNVVASAASDNFFNSFNFWKQLL